MLITVQFVNQPNKNPKFGSIKSTDGVFYDIGAAHLDKYRQGMTFDAPVKEREWKGKTYYSIPDSFNPASDGTYPAQNGHTAPAPPRAAPAPYADKDDLITRLAILKSLIESGALLQGGQSMDDLVEMAWTTAPKLKVWQR